MPHHFNIFFLAFLMKFDYPAFKKNEKKKKKKS